VVDGVLGIACLLNVKAPVQDLVEHFMPNTEKWVHGVMAATDSKSSMTEVLRQPLLDYWRLMEH
jgi:hypothetical protein